MDFILASSLPACGIPWEKVLPPLLPRLNAMYGPQCGWNQLVTPRTAEPCSPSSAQVECDSRGFVVRVDVKLFRPEELLVKVTGDFVEVQGKHQETKRDGPGVITRQFNRRYRIPDGVDALALESAVSPEGILVISAPLLLPQACKDRAGPCPPPSHADGFSTITPPTSSQADAFSTTTPHADTFFSTTTPPSSHADAFCPTTPPSSQAEAFSTTTPPPSSHADASSTTTPHADAFSSTTTPPPSHADRAGSVSSQTS